ncbi:dihydroorotase [Listeria booriae]|uniref:dihydroorotase n=1 Tax=Listeria booriae TaxID=1552123 RepID=UPI001625960A|nr:dihydroorotase [Listeria booriae]MBC1975826.1 dihydroorotase [Listeria booriae]MBC1985474.1 dihydroorotase [Listeria booriae]MBC2033868.1 dihydroorotase [Listeria booriae]MBC2263320.1 dihydroorotase [Listeria booriae]
MYVLKNGQVLTENGDLEVKDVVMEDGRVTAIGDGLERDGAQVIDVAGKLVAPGLVDVHVHLREPGGEHKETIATGTAAAARGGYTTVCAMPNTKPVPDTAEVMTQVVDRIKETAKVRVLPYASITSSLKGDELVDFAALKAAGAFAFTDDGVGVQTAGMMYEAMKKAAALDMAIVAHCEDNSLVYGGVVHDGIFAKEQGLAGIPNIAESVQIARDVLLAEAANCHYHVCHISTKESVRAVRDAKRAGIHVTAEVSPHHLILNETDIPGNDGNWKMNPPLRAKEDHEALLEGLLDGTIDFIATDHAPHAAEEKNVPMEKAMFGIVGLETAFPLLYTHFVKSGEWTLKQLIDWMTVKPAEVFNLPYGVLEIGGIADITVIDLEKEAVIDPDNFASKGRNTPFTGWNCIGWPVATFAEGTLVYQEGVE